MDITKHKTLFFITAILTGGLFGAIFLQLPMTDALVNYPPAALLQPGDITGTMIRNSAIGPQHIDRTSSLNGANATSGTEFTFVSSGTQTFYGQKTFNTAPNLNLTPPVNPTDPATKSYVDASLGVSKTSVCTLATTTVGTAVSVVPFAGVKHFNHGTTATFATVTQNGSTANGVAECFTIATTTTASTVTWSAQHTGTGINNVLIFLEGDVTSTPNNVVLASTSIADAQFATSDGSANFNTTTTLSGGSNYCLVASSSMALSDANSESLFVATSSQDNSIVRYWNGSSWTALAPTAGYSAISLSLNDPHVAVELASAAQAASTTYYLGITESAMNPFTCGYVDVSGISSAGNDLSYPDPLYLTNTAGGVSSTPGTTIFKIGKALTSSTIMLLPQ